MAFDTHKNLAVSLVATAPSPATSGATLVVTAGQGGRFAAGMPVMICPVGVTPDPSNAEIARCTGVATDTLTLTRAQEGTSARTVVVGDQIIGAITAKTFTDIESVVLSPTAAKTANYTAAAGELVPCDISSGSFTVTLPTAPADKTQICIEVVNRVTTLTSNSLVPFYVTIACGGSDVLFRASGPTSGIFGRGSVIFQYNASAAIWYAPGQGDLLPIGWTFGHKQIVSSVNITSTTEATGTAVITGDALVFDGGPVMAEFFTPSVFPGSTIGQFMVISLFEGSTEIGILGAYYVTSTGGGATTLSMQLASGGSCRFIPSAGSHTYKVTAFVSGIGGTPAILAGAGGTAANFPAYLRFAKV